MKKEHDEKVLPKWAQNRLEELRFAVKSLEGLRQLSNFLADDERDWFVLSDPVNGCTDDKLSFWILNGDSPFRVCTLYKGDKLFIGRATKARYNTRLTGLPSSHKEASHVR